MSILVLIGSWKAPSELFILRQLRMLREMGHLSCIVAARMQGDTRWHGIDVIGLSDQDYDLLGNQRPDIDFQKNRLTQILSTTKATTIFCHFGTVATLFYDLLQATDKSVIIHMHGKDSHRNMHDAAYIRKIQRLSQKALMVCNPITYEFLSGEGWSIPKQRLRLKTVYGVEAPDAPIERTPTSSVKILHLGRFVDFKGPIQTIQAFEIACEDGLDGKLVMAGDGPLMQDCQQLVSKSKWKNAIQLLGFVTPTEAQQLYAEADIFTQHSLIGTETGQIETFGVSIIEAMAAALPVVSCNVGGPGRNIKDGETGILIKPGDTQAQAKAFLRLAEDRALRIQLGTNAWLQVKEQFTCGHEFAELKQIVEESIS